VQATKLIRKAISFMHTLDDVPDERCITLQLLYHDGACLCRAGLTSAPAWPPHPSLRLQM
jgi:hypothetical protein